MITHRWIPVDATRVQYPAKFPSKDILKACSKGLTKRMKGASKAEKARLKEIRKEINLLLEVL
jgi:hypothetical protein